MSMCRAGGIGDRSPVDTHVIHEHGLRINAGCGGSSGPVASHGHIQQQEKWVVINPLRSLGQVGRRASRVEMIIHVEADRLRLPFSSVNMKVVGKGAMVGRLVGSGGAFVAGISRAMYGAVNQRRLLADI